MTGALAALWSAIDPDEPLLCGCTPGHTCADCALAEPVGAVTDWPSPARAPSAAPAA